MLLRTETLKESLFKYLERSLEFPREIHLESSSRCNAHCLTCPRDKLQREVGELPRELFMKAVNETSSYTMDYIMFHLNGEPLFLDIDELVWRINYTRAQNPNTNKLTMFTNGSLLNEERADKLLTSSLDELLISIDGGTKEDYEKIRKGLSWDILIHNVRNLVKRKRELKSKLTIITAIIPQVANKDSISKYFVLFGGLGVDHVGGSGVNNIGGLIDAVNMKLNEQHNDLSALRLPCFKIFLDLSIMSDGRACVCAQDVVGALPIGDLYTQTLKEIWQGKVMTEIRKNFVYGKKSVIPFCGGCDYMSGFVYPDFWGVSQEDWIDVFNRVKEEQ